MSWRAALSLGLVAGIVASAANEVALADDDPRLSATRAVHASRHIDDVVDSPRIDVDARGEVIVVYRTAAYSQARGPEVIVRRLPAARKRRRAVIALSNAQEPEQLDWRAFWGDDHRLLDAAVDDEGTTYVVWRNRLTRIARDGTRAPELTLDTFDTRLATRAGVLHVVGEVDTGRHTNLSWRTVDADWQLSAEHAQFFGLRPFDSEFSPQYFPRPLGAVFVHSPAVHLGPDDSVRVTWLQTVIDHDYSAGVGTQFLVDLRSDGTRGKVQYVAAPVPSVDHLAQVESAATADGSVHAARHTCVGGSCYVTYARIGPAGESRGQRVAVSMDDWIGVGADGRDRASYGFAWREDRPGFSSLRPDNAGLYVVRVSPVSEDREIIRVADAPDVEAEMGVGLDGAVLFAWVRPSADGKPDAIVLDGMNAETELYREAAIRAGHDVADVIVRRLPSRGKPRFVVAWTARRRANGPRGVFVSRIRAQR